MLWGAYSERSDPRELRYPRSGLCAQARVCASAKHGTDSPDPEFAPCVEHRDIGCTDGFVPLIVLVTRSHEMPGPPASIIVVLTGFSLACVPSLPYHFRHHYSACGWPSSGHYYCVLFYLLGWLMLCCSTMLVLFHVVRCAVWCCSLPYLLRWCAMCLLLPWWRSNELVLYRFAVLLRWCFKRFPSLCLCVALL